MWTTQKNQETGPSFLSLYTPQFKVRITIYTETKQREFSICKMKKMG